MGSAIFQGYPLGGQNVPIPIGVFAPGPEGSYIALPQVRCVQIEEFEGARPPEASFRWVLLDRPGWDYPSGFERILPVAAAGSGVLRTDDEVFVASITPVGVLRWLFAGTVLAPGLGLTDKSQTLGFEAVGWPARTWDAPIRGSYWRPAHKPHEPDSEVWTTLPARFNPRGKGNFSVPVNDLETDSGGKRGAFLDPEANIDPAERALATLPQAVRYVAWAGHDETWVKNPTPEEIDAACSIMVSSGFGFVDPENPDTYDIVEPNLPDLSVADLPPFEAIERILSRMGWGFSFRLRTAASGDPEYTWDCYPLANPEARRVKTVGLQPGGILDRSLTNLKGASVRRDTEGIVNQFRASSGPTEVECSLVLVPLFVIDPADATAANKPKFKRTSKDTAVDPRKYRLWGVDECGEGHWDPKTWAWVAGSPGDLSRLKAAGLVVARRRRIGGTLFSKGPDGRPRRAELAVLRGYSGGPGVWDGTGEVLPGKIDFRADPESLAVWLTADDPASLHIGRVDDVAGIQGGLIPQIDWLALSANSSKRFVLLLTCTIPTDRHPEVVAERTAVSPTRFKVTRHVQAEDRQVHQQIAPSSRYYDASKAEDGFVPVRDLDAEIRPELEARRAAHEVGPLSGTVEIPRIVNTIGPGDVLARIEGRNCDLRADAGGGTDAPILPRVVSRLWEFAERQRTVLRLSASVGSDRGL